MERLLELSTELGRVLVVKHLKLSTVESCTGGWIGQSLTAVAGSSAWYERGFVTYSNSSKVELVGVPPEVISQAGAVSKPVVQAMARGALSHSHADLALAVTGIAGPDGGSAGKPVGTVWLGWIARTGMERAEQYLFTGDREAVRRQSVIEALSGLIRFLEEDPSQ
jgi:nicotinamide-nucleotide amidase